MVNNEKVRFAYKKVIEEFKAEALAIGDDTKVEMSNKFLNDLAKNEFDVNEFEIINHALFKVEKEDDVLVDKYINENPKAFKKAFSLAVAGKLVAIIGDTGVGKGYTLHKLLKKHKGRAIIVQPSASVTEQMAEDYKDVMVGCYGRGKSLDTLLKEGHRVIVCTWDKLKVAIDKGVDFSDIVLIKDEVHEIVSNGFRSKVIRPIDTYCSKHNVKFQGVIDITATPTKLDMSKYDYIARYKKIKNIAKKHLLYNKVDSEAIIEILNKAKKAIVVENNIERLEFYQSKIIGKKSEVVHADIKEKSAVYKSIMKKGTLGKCEILLTTNILNAGINIYDTDVTDIIIVGIPDTTQIGQIDSRCRKVDSINIHLFNNFPRNSRNFRRVERDIRKMINFLKGYADKLNSLDVDRYLKEECMNIGAEDSNIYQNTDGLYVVDESGVRTKLYKSYYETRSRLQLKVLLSEISNDVVLIDTNGNVELEKERKKIARAVRKKSKNEVNSLEEFKGKLVGCNSIYKGEELTEGIKDYLSRNKLSKDDLIKFYDALNINFDDNGFIQHIELFTQLVTEENCDLEFAWKWASASESERSKISCMIDFLKYKKIKETDCETQLNEIKKANPSLNRMDYIFSELPLGIRYTNDVHIPLLLKEANKKTRNNTIGEKELKSLLNCMFKVNRSNTKADATLFYKGKLPKVKNKKGTYNHYILESHITINDVAKTLGVDATNITLNKLINK